MNDQLGREIAGLGAAAADFAARHQRIPRLSYPPGIQMAVNFTADFDAMLLRRLMNEPPMQLAKGEFGGRVGIWRLIELFDTPRRQGDDLHPGPHLRTLPARGAGGGAQRPRDRRPHVGAPRSARSRSWSATICARPARRWRSSTGRRPVGTRSKHSLRAAEGGRLHLHLGRLGRPSAVLRARCARRSQPPAEPAVPPRHRRRDVLQLRLDGQRERGPAHDRSRPRLGSLVGCLHPAIPRGRLPERLSCIPSCRAARCASPCSTGSSRG